MNAPHNSLAAIREKLAAMESSKDGKARTTTNQDNAIYPHWKIKDQETTSLRFLPDGDPSNVFFWVERQVIRLSFPGVVGSTEQKPVQVQVPCGEMYGDTCPVLTAVRPFFKDPSLEDMGRKYWKKRSYIFQGFVQDASPVIDEESVPENPIRRFMVTPQIFNLIKASIMDPDVEHAHTDYENGRDFRVTKTEAGGYAGYTTSAWRSVGSALSQEQRDAIDTYELQDLKTFLPKRPDQDHYRVINEMFEASFDGELYDPVRWGNYYRPWGVDLPSNAVPTAASGETAPAAPVAAPSFAADVATAEAATAAPAAPAAPVAAPEPAPVAAAPADGGANSSESILAMIKKRQNNS